MFDHYLITRFNLRASFWNTTKNNEKLLTDEWMENRMWLFENFCFPTVVSQSNKNFKWLLFFDENTKEIYKNRIEKLVENYPHFVVFFINGMDAFYGELTTYIKQNSSDKPYLITSRIDNDDSIHKDFINEIQKQFKQQDFCAIDFIAGYSIQIEPQFILGKKEQLFNPFISLIEKNENPETALNKDHRMWKKEKRVLQITNKRLWLSIIHHKNKINKFDGYGNVSWSDIKNDFTLSDEVNKLLNQKLISFSQWRLLSLKNYINQKFEIKFKLLKRALGVYNS
ncbi:glycosyltransferase [Flavobacterium sp.]|uniref:glycosyltransferase n=1 Tax=Flavobacterium sp. TaxID=239 RepID=UPI0035AFA978